MAQEMAALVITVIVTLPSPSLVVTLDGATITHPQEYAIYWVVTLQWTLHGHSASTHDSLKTFLLSVAQVTFYKSRSDHMTSR